MPNLVACPFCRQLFAQGEVTRCPECGVDVVASHKLPPSLEAQALQAADPIPPEYERLPWMFLGRGRGLLLALAAAGIALLFAPWLHEHAPEIRVLSGFEFARKLGWLWAAPVAWFIMFAVVLSRRTIYHMRGSRLAVILLAVMVLMTVVWRIVLLPAPDRFLTRRYEWGWGLYGSGVLALAAIAAAIRFGGSLRDMPTAAKRQGNETVH
jgi:hypothetical protein